MYLSRLEIQGFKSFANKTSLDFQRGITAIVGPNGSGKSNVSDAIRWVLGEQSLKLLRGKKSDDVIFAGSDKKSRLGAAEVSLILNNEDGRAPVDYSEVVITRRIFRDGEGEYLINRQPARLQDIQLLLAQANFGQRTYSVIGQGMIDNFLLSSPQERKHLFDEAAGVRQYQMKKDQALSKLAHSKENLAQGEAIMMEIEPRLRSLTRQVRRLEKRDEVEKELREKQTQYFGLLWQAIDRELTELKADHEKFDRQRQEVTKEQTTTQQELELIERERSASEIFTGLQKRYNQILDEKNRLLEQLSKVKGQLELAAGQAGQAETAFLQKRSQELQQSITDVQEEIRLRESELQRLQQQLKKAQAELGQVEKDFLGLQHQLQQAERRLKSSFTLPQAKDMVSAFLQKYRIFVEFLHGNETIDHAAAKQQSKRLDEELEHIVKQLESATGGQDPMATTQLHRQIVEAADRRQALLQSTLRIEGEVRMHEHQLEQLAVSRQKFERELKTIDQDASIQELAKTNPEAAYAAYVAEAKRIENQVRTTDQQLTAAREEINSFNTKETSKKERLFSLQKDFRDTQHRLNVVTNQVNEFEVKIARVEQRHEDLQREINQSMSPEAVGIIKATAAKQLAGDAAMLAEDIGHLQRQLQLIGGIDEQTKQEYQETNERWEFLNGQAEDLKAAIISLENAIAELDKIIKDRFDAAFKKINHEFNTYFRTLFRGGRAELVLIKEVPRVVEEQDEDDEDDVKSRGDHVALREDEDDVEERAAPAKAQEKVITGIDIKATPPGKKLSSIAMLSGGERALTSIALLCAIISNNPSPFVALDEVDAALDEANSQRFAAILEQLADKTQFITTTHNRATMEKAGILYGVTMGDDGVSQLVSVKMDDVEKIIQSYGNR